MLQLGMACMYQHPFLLQQYKEYCQSTSDKSCEQSQRRKYEQQYIQAMARQIRYASKQQQGVLSSLACQNPLQSQDVAALLRDTNPHIAIYLAACANDTELWQKWLQEHWAQGDDHQNSAVLSFLLQPNAPYTLQNRQQLQDLATSKKLSGLLSSYVLQAAERRK